MGYLVDINGVEVTSFKIDNLIVKGFKNNQVTSSLNSESCSKLNYYFRNGSCYWKNNVNGSEYFLKIDENPFNIGKGISHNCQFSSELKILIDFDVEYINFDDFIDNIDGVKVDFVLFNKITNDVITTRTIFNGKNLKSILLNSENEPNQNSGINFSSSSEFKFNLFKNNLQNFYGTPFSGKSMLGTYKVNKISVRNELLPINTDISYGFKVVSNISELSLRVDNVSFNTNCSLEKYTLTKNKEILSFDLQKVIDNKKSWSDSDNKRTYTTKNSTTSYLLSDENLLMNSKDLDLELSPSNHLNDLFYESIKKLNPNMELRLSSGKTNDPNFTLIKLSNEPNEFDKSNYGSFGSYVRKNLVNPKNYKTAERNMLIETLKNYYTNNDDFLVNNERYGRDMAFKVGDFWVDAVEQLVPATALWQSTLRIKDSIYSTPNKFRYRKYNLIPEKSPLNKISTPMLMNQTTITFAENGSVESMLIIKDIEYNIATFSNGTDSKTEVKIINM